MAHTHSTRRLVASGILTFIALTLRPAAQSTTASDLFHQALIMERGNGQTAGAIFLYERVIADFPTDKTTVPQALFRLAELYEQRADGRAVVLFTRLARDYASSAFAARARTHLASLKSRSAGSFDMRDVSPYFDQAVELVGSVPVIAPNARSVAYVNRGGHTDGTDGKLHVRDLSTGRERVVFESGDRIGSVTWSPDGQRVAFEVRHGDNTPGKPLDRALHVVTVASKADWLVDTVPLPGPSAPPLRLLYRVTWAPDSMHLAFDRGGPSDIRVATIVGQTMQSFGAADDRTDGWAWASAIRWFADSARFLFHHASTDGHREDIRIATLSNGGVRTLAIPAEISGDLSIGVIKNNGALPLWELRPQGEVLWMLPLDGAPARKAYAPAARGDVGLTVMPDGRRVVVWRKSSTNYAVRNTETGVETPLTLSSGEEKLYRDLAGGRLAAFASNRDGHWAEYVVDLDDIPVAHPVRLRDLDVDPERLGAHAWTADGRVVVQNFTAASGVHRVEIDPATGHVSGRPERLTQDTPRNVFATIAPDMKHIAYRYSAGAHFGVAIMDANGAQERPVSDDPNENMRPLWLSADTLLLRQAPPLSKDLSVDRHVVVRSLNIATGDSAVVAETTLPAKSDVLDYVPATHEIYFDFNDGDQIAVVARTLPDGRDRAIVKAYDVNDCRVSRDATSIACAYASAAGKPYELHVMTANGQNDRLVYRAANKVDLLPTGWSPDGRFLLVTEDEDSPVTRVINVETGESWPLLDADGRASVPEQSAADWSADGRFVTFNDYSQRDVWTTWSNLTVENVHRLTLAKK